MKNFQKIKKDPEKHLRHIFVKLQVYLFEFQRLLIDIGCYETNMKLYRIFPMKSAMLMIYGAVTEECRKT